VKFLSLSGEPEMVTETLGKMLEASNSLRINANIEPKKRWFTTAGIQKRLDKTLLFDSRELA